MSKLARSLLALTFVTGMALVGGACGESESPSRGNSTVATEGPVSSPPNELTTQTTAIPSTVSSPPLEATTVQLPLEVPSATSGQEPLGSQLVFADEFDGAVLDTSKWVLADPFGTVRNEELQAYVPEAISVSDGYLHVTASRTQAVYDGAVRDYSSGMMTTHGKFAQQYGRFEIRCRVPSGSGLWPAFWLHPATLRWPPEIDVLEVLGQDPTQAYFTNHWGDTPAKHQQNQGSYRGPDFSADFHVFAMDWSPEAIVWSVEGQEVFRSELGIPQESMFLMINLAIGGSWQQPPDQTTLLPASFDVDYIRVYSQ